MYEGEFTDGKRHGYGTMRTMQEVYMGNWYKGMKHGHGKQTEATGLVYEGEWK